MADPLSRFVAFDLHKSYAVVGAVNAQLDVILRPQRVLLSQLSAWVQQRLHAADIVVMEAGANTWYVHDLVQPQVARVVVANTHDIKLIAASAVKTDKRDVLILARLLAAGIVPEVWVPPVPVRELRSLITHRQHLVGQRTAAKNRLRSLLMYHHIAPPQGDLFAAAQRAWWEQCPLSAMERIRALQDLRRVDNACEMLGEIDAELGRLSVSPPWEEHVAYLVQLPGIGLVAAMTIQAAVGDITRFASAKHLVGYSGLGARVHASGQTNRSGGISKHGRRELRRVMIEAAWSAVRYSPYWKEQFERLRDRVGHGKAITAIARKLLVVVWHVLHERTADRHADASAVARSFMHWADRKRAARAAGLSQPAFIRRELDRVGLGREVRAIKYNGQMRPLPASTAVTGVPTPSG